MHSIYNDRLGRTPPSKKSPPPQKNGARISTPTFFFSIPQKRNNGRCWALPNEIQTPQPATRVCNEDLGEVFVCARLRKLQVWNMGI